jgi:hypothetical protein
MGGTIGSSVAWRWSEQVAQLGGMLYSMVSARLGGLSIGLTRGRIWVGTGETVARPAVGRCGLTHAA